MWKKAPARFNNISSSNTENAETDSVDDNESPVSKAQKKRKLETGAAESDNAADLGTEQSTKEPDVEDQNNNIDAEAFGDGNVDIDASTPKAPESARKTMAAKFKSIHVFKDKDDFLELLVGHSYSNKYSCYHNAVHQCIIHEDFEGFPCEHQFRICERTDDKGEKVYDLQERGVHSTVLKLDRSRGVHPLMIMDVDEMLMSQVPPSQIIKALKQKYEGQPDMLALIPKKTKIISRKITAKVKGPMKRSSFPYTPPMSTAQRPVKPTPLTSGEMQNIHALTEGEYKLVFSKPNQGSSSAAAGGGHINLYDSNYALMSNEYLASHLPDSGSSSDEDEDIIIQPRQLVSAAAGAPLSSTVGVSLSAPAAALSSSSDGVLGFSHSANAAIPDSL